MFAKLFCRSSRPPVRFTLRLETLDGRVAPGALAGGVFASGGLTTASQVGNADPQVGEEIPQGAGGGHMENFGGRVITGDV